MRAKVNKKYFYKGNTFSLKDLTEAKSRLKEWIVGYLKYGIMVKSIEQATSNGSHNISIEGLSVDNTRAEFFHSTEEVYVPLLKGFVIIVNITKCGRNLFINIDKGVPESIVSALNLEEIAEFISSELHPNNSSKAFNVNINGYDGFQASYIILAKDINEAERKAINFAFKMHFGFITVDSIIEI